MKVQVIYPGATWAVYEVAIGYVEALQELGHTVRVFNFHDTYAVWTDFFNFLHTRKGGTFPPDAATMWASKMSIIDMIEFLPDVVLVITGLAWHKRAYMLAHCLDVPVAVLFTESPYMDDQQALIASKGFVRLAFVNEKTSVATFAEKAPDVPTVYLPHSFSTKRHRVFDVEQEYRSDLFFHGTRWDERGALLDAIDLPGRDVHISTARFVTRVDLETGLERQTVEGEVIPNDELVKWYNGTKIALNHHRRDVWGGGLVAAHAAYSLGPRAFEIAATRTCQLCDDQRQELVDVFGDSVATYANAQELNRKAEYLLSHDDERTDMASAALERVRACSFLNRAREIMIPAIEQHIMRGA